MARGDIRVIREIVADHDGWEEEVAAMDRDVAYLLRGLEHELTLDVNSTGYWFMIRDKPDPCGFAFISNQAGVIFSAEPIR